MPDKWSVIETNRQFEILNTNMPKKSDLQPPLTDRVLFLFVAADQEIVPIYK